MFKNDELIGISKVNKENHPMLLMLSLSLDLKEIIFVRPRLQKLLSRR